MDHERLVNEVGYDKSRGTQHRDLPTVSGALCMMTQVVGWQSC